MTCNCIRIGGELGGELGRGLETSLLRLSRRAMAFRLPIAIRAGGWGHVLCGMDGARLVSVTFRNFRAQRWRTHMVDTPSTGLFVRF